MRASASQFRSLIRVTFVFYTKRVRVPDRVATSDMFDPLGDLQRYYDRIIQLKAYLSIL